MSKNECSFWVSQLPPFKDLGRLQLDRPLVVFDLETTGINRNKDRIVEFGAIKVFTDGRTRFFRWLINPGTPIPLRASKVHKIRDEDVAQSPMFGAWADSIIEIFQDSDILGFNSIAFDQPFLQAEFIRLQQATGRVYKFPPDGARQIDAMRIYHRKEKKKGQQQAQSSSQTCSDATAWERPVKGDVELEDTADSTQTRQIVDTIESSPASKTFEGCSSQQGASSKSEEPKMNLTRALSFYCGYELKNAHTAVADADATLRVLIGQLNMYPDLPVEVQGLHDFCLAKVQKTPSKERPAKPDMDSLVDAFDKLLSREDNPDKAELRALCEKMKSLNKSAESPLPKARAGQKTGKSVQGVTADQPSKCTGSKSTGQSQSLPINPSSLPPLQNDSKHGGTDSHLLKEPSQAISQEQQGESLNLHCPKTEPKTNDFQAGQPAESASKPDSAYRQGRSYIEWQDKEPILTFGKHKGKPLPLVAESDYSYLIWLQGQDFPTDFLGLVGFYTQTAHAPAMYGDANIV